MTATLLKNKKQQYKEIIEEADSLIKAAQDNLIDGYQDIAEEYFRDAGYVIMQIENKDDRELIAAIFTPNPLDFC